MKRKDFFKWSFGLRFLFVSLCALMCIGNAWGTIYSNCEITAETRDGDNNVDGNNIGGLVNAKSTGTSVTNFASDNYTLSDFSYPSSKGEFNKTSGSYIMMYVAYICYHGYKFDKFESKSNWNSNSSYTFKYRGEAKASANLPLCYYEPIIYWGGRASSYATAQKDAVTTTAKAIFVPNDNYITVNFQSTGIDGVTYNLHTNTLTSTSSKVAFGINHGDQSVNIYDNEHVTYEYTIATELSELVTFSNWWVSTDGGNTKYQITVGQNKQLKDTASLYRVAKNALIANGQTFENHMTLTFGATFTAPPMYTINLEAPEVLSYTYEHTRGTSVKHSGTKSPGDANTTFQVLGDDKIKLTHANLPRGTKFKLFYTKTTSDGSKTHYGTAYQQKYRTFDNGFTSDLWMGTEFEQRTQYNITYRATTNGSYTAVGTDPDGGNYPTITTDGTSTITTCYGDEIALHAAPIYGYKLSKWYVTTDNGSTKTTIESTALNMTIDVGTRFRKHGSDYDSGVVFDHVFDFGVDFVARSNPFSVIYEEAAHGSYTAVGTDNYGSGAYPTITIGGAAVTTYSDDDVRLTVSSKDAGYHFHRFYAVVGGKKQTLGDLLVPDQTVSIPQGATAVGAEFTNAPFYIGGVFAEDLQSAIQAAQSEINNGASSSTIVVTDDVTVEAGNYTIPANVTLLIPYEDGQLTVNTEPSIAEAGNPLGAYHTLTLADGAHLEVFGTIEVSGRQTTGGPDAQGEAVPSRTAGPYYGLMDMKGGSSITLNNGAHLYALGFVIGDIGADGRYTCGIDVRRGATVHEHFQIGDWKGAFPTIKVCDYESTKKVLPISQYFIQNVEVPALYRPGSRLLGSASVNVDLMNNENGTRGITMAMTDAGIVGIKYPNKPDESDKAVFLLNNEDESEDTWVRKFYDPATDQQVYEINNTADVGSLVMYVTLPGLGDVLQRPENMQNRDRVNVDSRYYQLPITNNFKMHLLSGNMYITQMTEMLPGSVIEINKQSTMTINETVSGTNDQSVYPTLLFYDADQWGAYVYKNTVNHVKNFTYGSRITYRPGGVPTVRDISTKDGQGDAQLIVHGTVDVKGKLFTTTSGASITSTIEDAGTIMYSVDAPESVGPTYQVSAIKNADNGNTPTFTAIPRVPAWLKNDAESTYSEADGFTETAETPAGESFCFVDIDKDGKGEWVSLTDEDCFVKDNDVYYAKPQEYVALANGKTANTDHTYSDAAGAGRLFILMDDCQWWEVENVDNLYHCLHPDNDTYYWWNEDRVVGEDVVPGWEEKKFAISWVNWDGSAILDPTVTNTTTYVDPYQLPYGVTPKYLHTHPTRPDDVDYTYNFIGWTPEIDSVKGDATYTAVYEKIQKKYTIIFNDADGIEIKRQQLALGANPEPPAIPTGSYWNPAIAVVSGNATYQVAVYDETPTAFTVTWANYNGSTIYSEQVAKDGVPTYDPNHGEPAVGNPTKNLNNEYNYTWTGWQSGAGTYGKEAALPEVDANITYTATFSSVEKTYTIRFYKEDGTTLIDEQSVAYGADPVAPEYSKPNTAQYTYSLEWENMSTYKTSVRTVTCAADYQASFVETLNRYTLKLQSNNNDVCTFTGAGVYDYGTTGIAVEATIADDYTFDHWSGVDWNTTSGTIAELTGDMTLTLYVKPEEAVSDLEVAPGSEEDIASATNYNDFVLTSNGTQSGQVTGVENIELFGDAYYDLILDNPQSRTWYSVAVPWQVDATSGIWAKNGTSARRLVLGSDFDIIYYNGARRAAGESQAWDYLEEQSSKIMMPGKAYMIAFRSAPQTIRFQKVSRAALLNTQTSVESYPSGDPAKANWNGIANPALYYAYINAGATQGQTYNAASRSYSEPFMMSGHKFIVGEPVYVQTPNPKTIVANAGSYPVSAPRRERVSAEKTYYQVELAQNGTMNGRIFLYTDEEKADEYVIGQDLAKMGVNSQAAQMWVNRYNAKLCVNTTAFEDGVATYPLVLSAPQADAYTIEVVAQPDDDNDLYLTLDGQAIWNLSDGAYTANLEKGTTDRYGLRVSAKTPHVVTGVEETSAATKEAAIKMLIDNQVFIIRGERVYTIDGQLVK